MDPKLVAVNGMRSYFRTADESSPWFLVIGIMIILCYFRTSFIVLIFLVTMVQLIMEIDFAIGK